MATQYKVTALIKCESLRACESERLRRGTAIRAHSREHGTWRDFCVCAKASESKGDKEAPLRWRPMAYQWRVHWPGAAGRMAHPPKRVRGPFLSHGRASEMVKGRRGRELADAVERPFAASSPMKKKRRETQADLIAVAGDRCGRRITVLHYLLARRFQSGACEVPGDERRGPPQRRSETSHRSTSPSREFRGHAFRSNPCGMSDKRLL
jgi:hypothetical protein